MINTATNMRVNVFVQMYVFISLGRIPELQGIRETLKITPVSPHSLRFDAFGLGWDKALVFF